MGTSEWSKINPDTGKPWTKAEFKVIADDLAEYAKEQKAESPPQELHYNDPLSRKNIGMGVAALTLGSGAMVYGNRKINQAMVKRNEQSIAEGGVNRIPKEQVKTSKLKNLKKYYKNIDWKDDPTGEKAKLKQKFLLSQSASYASAVPSIALILKQSLKPSKKNLASVAGSLALGQGASAYARHQLNRAKALDEEKIASMGYLLDDLEKTASEDKRRWRDVKERRDILKWMDRAYDYVDKKGKVGKKRWLLNELDEPNEDYYE